MRVKCITRRSKSLRTLRDPLVDRLKTWYFQLAILNSKTIKSMAGFIKARRYAVLRS